MARFVPFIIKTDGSQNISVKIVRMKKSDAVQTEKEPVWQTSWLSDYIQDDAFEKYALKTSDGELVALAAYEILENDVMVHIPSHFALNPGMGTMRGVMFSVLWLAK